MSWERYFFHVVENIVVVAVVLGSAVYLLSISNIFPQLVGVAILFVGVFWLIRINTDFMKLVEESETTNQKKEDK